jgi:hypothetical protein
VVIKSLVFPAPPAPGRDRQAADVEMQTARGT